MKIVILNTGGAKYVAENLHHWVNEIFFSSSHVHNLFGDVIYPFKFEVELNVPSTIFYMCIQFWYPLGFYDV